MRLRNLLIGATLMLALTSTATASVVNIDSRLNNSFDNAIELFLDAGTYTLTPIGPDDGGAYTAWMAWSAVENCQLDHSCARGWLHYYTVYSPSIGGNFLGSLNARFDSAPNALANASVETFTLTQAESVFFFIDDPVNMDNFGGVSLALAVPEPATALLLAAGLVGLAIGRKRIAGS